MSSKESTTRPNIIHSIYYYIVIAGCVLTLSISSFILFRRILIDTALPQLRSDDYAYYSSTTRDSLRYSYPECDSESDRYDSDACDNLVEKKQNEENSLSEERYQKTRTEQYVYSLLSIIIAAIVAGVHIVFFRPSKSK